MMRLQVTLNEDEAEKLAKWAREDLRDPRDQIRFIVRRALEQQASTEEEPGSKENNHDYE